MSNLEIHLSLISILFLREQIRKNRRVRTQRLLEELKLNANETT